MRRSPVGQDVERLGDDGALDAAARHRAGHLAVLVHGHGRPGIAGARALDVDDPGERHALAGRRQRSMSSRISFIARAPAVPSRSARSRRPAPRARPASGPRRSRRRRAARPPCRGPAARSPGDAFSGLTHTTRWATRCSRAICSASTSGSPRSQPSDRMTTTAPAGHAPDAPAVVEAGAGPRRGGCRPTSRRPRRRPRPGPRRGRATTARG